MDRKKKKTTIELTCWRCQSPFSREYENGSELHENNTMCDECTMKKYPTMKAHCPHCDHEFYHQS